MRQNRCCFAGCKYKHTSMIYILDHMFKEHNLKINGKPIYVRKYTADPVIIEEERDALCENHVGDKK